MDQRWFKYEYVCGICDALIEYTSTRNVTDITCECGGDTTMLSVVDATILPIIQQEKEVKMETAVAPQTMTLNWIENDVERTQTYTENDVRAMQWNVKNLAEKQNAWYLKENKLRTLLEEVYADSEEQEVLSQIADIFDVPLTKDIEVTAWVRVDMTIEVDMADGDYDIEDMVRNNLTIDSFGSEISVNDYDVDRVEEGAY